MTFYVPRHFRVEDESELVAFVEAHAFATLVSDGPGGLAVSHLPFLVERGPGGSIRLLGHVARANPHGEALADGREALAIFMGPHAYVSPAWYATQPSVPTWNYAVVHARGQARRLDSGELEDLVRRLSDAYERGRESPWSHESLPRDFVDRMLGAITGFALEAVRLEGKFKLSQNRSAADARGAIAALEARGEGDIASLMRRHRPVRPGESG